MLLKNSQYSQENTCAGPCRPSFTEQLSWLLQHFRGSKYFFQVNLVFIADRHTGFCPELLRKHDLNLRSSHELFCKKVFLEILQMSQETPVLKFLFNRVARGLQLYEKETLTQTFPWRIYKIFKNTKFEDYERLLLKPVLSPELPFLVTYTSDTN